ncbi:glucan endo-1,3-beta-glucosidase-like [Phoenix dactylifera]|uniref:Glucan endo-1,3-beta-glucosidase-like n=1 Tax=Phoenix dactylifera TaxID=42345 RepID=A0A8B8ZM45_PHODC|nr:glucan endo-1,3-beta-glucosidase-like [Phoenix dactylifera]
MAWDSIICFLLILLSTFHHATHAAPSSKIGICYGTKGDNLPTPTEIIALLKGCSIKKLRLYDANPQLLEAVAAIIKPPDVLELAIAARNEELADLAASPDAAIDWVGMNILPFRTPVLSFQDILVGSEVAPGENARYIVAAMQNLRSALRHANMTESTVSTVVSFSVLQNTFPPSQATFTPEANEIMKDFVSFQLSLPSGIRGYIYINIYPYFSHAADPEHISLDHALFQGKAPMLKDGNLTYWNLFDAMYDAFLWALEKVGGAELTVMVGESGWPSAGNGASTTPELASTYLTNFYNHISEAGTPKLPPKVGFEGAYVYALYDENLKPAGVEQHFGLFYPNMKPVYTPNPMCHIN